MLLLQFEALALALAADPPAAAALALAAALASPAIVLELELAVVVGLELKNESSSNELSLKKVSSALLSLLSEYLECLKLKLFTMTDEVSSLMIDEVSSLMIDEDDDLLLSSLWLDDDLESELCLSLSFELLPSLVVLP
jgi:hypothetical protein